MLTTSENLNENLTKALEIYEKASHEELISMLENGSAAQRQISALQLDKICSAREARIFVSNLTGQDGKVREAVSFRLKEFISAEYFLSEENYDIFLQAVLDVNGNVCRSVISALCSIRNIPEFTQYFCPKLTALTKEILEQVRNNEKANSGYKVNKEVFKLYWCLEALYEFCEFLPEASVKEILLNTKDIKEYTIREKTAKILTKSFDSPDLLKIRQDLKNDRHYYVRRLM
ncbi:MAG: hypothetical protein LBK53_05220 [Heliobacteriaceae bacterium]|jgi:hypothetical protein|nr:hypothetical protein [Heliobacteriaceae bacterium]